MNLKHIDLTMYSDNELSLMVDNNECLYLLAQESVESLLNMIDEFYIYTDRQLEVLKDDLNDIISSS